jgi:mannose-6-phosphate isomerase
MHVSKLTCWDPWNFQRSNAFYQQSSLDSAVLVMHALASRRVVTKPWGKLDIGAFGSDATLVHGQPIGEIWFEPGASDVLVKYLFTSKRLSIQVHPDDNLAHKMNGGRGKEECWLILEADPGAHYGIGLSRQISAEELKDAALDGSIVDLIDWRPAHAGDFIYNAATTVHALGPGLTLLEVQQNSDITLRLFDYFSERTLHVDQAVRIARLGSHCHPLDTCIDFSRTRILVDGPKFGFAFCRGQLPNLSSNTRDIQLVTWKDTVKVCGDPVPAGSSVKLNNLDEISELGDQRYFLVWSITPSN